MAKEKKIKVKKKIDWKHEMALAPGYIIVFLWVAFTFMLLGLDHSSQSFYYNRYLCRKSIEIPVWDYTLKIMCRHGEVAELQHSLQTPSFMQ